MSLADLLQWADAISTAGVLTLERGSLCFWFQIESRHVICVQRPDGLIAQRTPMPGLEGVALLDDATLALEQLYDQFLDAGERFVFDPDGVPSAVGLPLRVSLQKLVMEGLRLLDEWPRLRAMYPADQARLRSTGASIDDPNAQRSLSAVWSCAQRGLTLSQARMALGLSRPALLRAVEELRATGHVDVEAAPSGIDLITQLMDQAAALIQARQFDEAQHVLRVLLATDPSLPRVKQLLREAEVLHVQALYTELPRNAVVHLGKPPEGSLSASDEMLLGHVNGRWDVSTLVLAGGVREIETLKALRRLWRQGLVQLHRT